MTLLAGFAIWGAAMIVVAALGGSPAGARIGLVLSASLLPLPFFVEGGTSRALLAFAIAVGLARAIDFAYGPAPAGFAARLAYLFALLVFVDTFSKSRCGRTFNQRAAMRAIVAVAAVACGVALWVGSIDYPPALRYALRCVSAAAIVLAGAEIVSSIVRLGSAMGGVSLPEVHNAPWLSRTLSEFWSRRWNPATARWFREHCFAHLSRHGTALALFATFAASAALHVYLIALAAGPEAMLSWAAFFLAQPLVILTERRLQVRRWPPAAGRAWTFTTLLLLSPLLFAPGARVLHTTL
jgi:hypothetical protein